VNGRLRRISKIISGLQTHGLGRQRDVLAWCRCDPLDFVQTESQKIDFAGPTL